MHKNTSRRPPLSENPPSTAEVLARLAATPSDTFDGVPSFFRKHCYTAEESATGYHDAGFHLGLHLLGLVPYDTEPERWEAIVRDDLVPLVQCADDAAIIAWLLRRFPKCMAKVPARRRLGGFVAGFREGFRAGLTRGGVL